MAELNHEAFMRRAIELSAKGGLVEKTGGCFGAVIVDAETGEVIGAVSERWGGLEAAERRWLGRERGRRRRARGGAPLATPHPLSWQGYNHVVLECNPTL